ncbi:alpha/beta fold hydrolase [Actinoplanes derwentensis]|uniref:alpha/beta fold hydrolase n=1 Tax=Actinoplanes derwentensis TaxID=113562 RepID=UPI001A61D8FB|nr:alpha/beta fold hydrolase [Actinoplanes derwentensis]GID84174.1 alpha/beta hydrolase [Actinoplanes derwentensis]
MATRFEVGVGARVLTVEVSGAAHGSPVFLLHGTPGSSTGPRPRPSMLYRQGIRLISYDRPGYGGSTRLPDRSVVDAAADVRAIADRLRLDRFAVVGRSGGGPHALACAAVLPHRVERAAVLVGLAPRNAADLNWYEGMADANARKHVTADRGTADHMHELRALAEQTADDPESLLAELRAQMSGPDLLFTRSVLFQRLLAKSYADALRVGPYGWLDDIQAFRREWGFALDTIVPPVRLWHGAHDTFSPASHSRWLAQRIPRSEVHVQHDAAHFGAMEALPPILAWLTA